MSIDLRCRGISQERNCQCKSSKNTRNWKLVNKAITDAYQEISPEKDKF